MPTEGTDRAVLMKPKPLNAVASEIQAAIDPFVTWDWSHDAKGLVLIPPERPKRYLNVCLKVGPLVVVQSIDMKNPAMTVGPTTARPKPAAGH